MNTKAIGTGSFPDVLYAQGVFWLAAQKPRGVQKWVTVWTWTPGDFSTWTLQAEIQVQNTNQLAYPRLGCVQQHILVAYALGDTGRLKDITVNTMPVKLGGVGGSHPVALGGDALAYRPGTGRTVIRDLQTGVETVHLRKAATGLSSLSEERVPVYMDDTFGGGPNAKPPAVTWGTKAFHVGDLTVAEGRNNSGVIGRFASVPTTQAWLWKGATAFEPRATTNGTIYAVCVGQPLRVVEITPADANVTLTL